DDDRLRVEHARHRGGVRKHPADERIDDVERRDVDQHAARAMLHDLLRQLFLQRDRGAVVHIHLDRRDQTLPNLQNRNALHLVSFYGFATTALPVRPRARRKASARVAFVTTTVSSTPRWTMVCAICGRMPLMMQSAPIRRAAATVFSRCCAVSVSTVGTPVMSMIASSAPRCTIASSRLSMMTCARWLSSVPI